MTNRTCPKDYAKWMVDAWGGERSRDLVQRVLNNHEHPSAMRSWWERVQDALPPLPPPPPVVPPPPPTPAQVAERWVMHRGVVYQIMQDGIFIPFKQPRFGYVQKAE